MNLRLERKKSMHKDFQLHTGLWRIQYWCTVIPLLAILLYTWSEYKDQEKLIEDGQRIYNRQLTLTGQSHIKKMEDLKMRHMAHVIHQQHHHQQEIGGLVEFYGNVIKEIEEKNDD